MVFAVAGRSMEERVAVTVICWVTLVGVDRLCDGGGVWDCVVCERGVATMLSSHATATNARMRG